MNKRVFPLFLALLSAIVAFAQPEVPKWAKKARNAVFSVITYDKEDNILNTGNGFFISESGEAVSDYTLFKGAERAIVITTGDKRLPVTHILGANEMYDIIKFRIDTGKEKITALPVDTTGVKTGETVWMLPYSTQKGVTCTHGKVEEVTKANEKYRYYTLRLPITDKMVSCPVTTEDGKVIALVQKPYGQQDNLTSYAVDAHFAASLSIGALTANGSTLRAIGIKKALPATEEEALVYLYMRSGNEKPEDYLALLDEFLTLYPSSAEGYRRRAELYVQSFRDSAHYELAEKDIAKAIELSGKKDEMHFALCRMMFFNHSAGHPFRYKDWGFESALTECRRAITIDSLPLYFQTEGDLLFMLRRYDEAHRAYMAVNRSNLATASTWYAAAQCLRLSGDTARIVNDSVLYLIDRAVNSYARPYPREAAPYLWERALALTDAGKPRAAVADYNEYHKLVNGKVNAHFYYQRAQTALAGRMNQQALDDLKRACETDSTNADYLAELGSLHARFNQPDEAISACQRALVLNPEYAACHRIIGICYNLKGDKEKTAEHLRKAKALGDTQSDALIEKYCK